MGEHRNARGKKRRRSSEMGEDNFDIGKHTSVASYDEMSSCFECFIWGLKETQTSSHRKETCGYLCDWNTKELMRKWSRGRYLRTVEKHHCFPPVKLCPDWVVGFMAYVF
jgi:hypothetical protein